MQCTLPCLQAIHQNTDKHHHWDHIKELERGGEWEGQDRKGRIRTSHSQLNTKAHSCNKAYPRLTQAVDIFKNELLNRYYEGM